VIDVLIATGGRSYRCGAVFVGASRARDPALRMRDGTWSTRGSRPGVAPTGGRGFCRSELCSRSGSPDARWHVIDAQIATGGRSYRCGAVFV